MAETEWGFDDPWPTVEDALEAAAVVAGKARELYGDELSDVMLYGSRARGDHCPESDLDVLMVKKSCDSMHWRDPIYKKLTDFVLFDLAAARNGGWYRCMHPRSNRCRRGTRRSIATSGLMPSGCRDVSG